MKHYLYFNLLHFTAVVAKLLKVVHSLLLNEKLCSHYLIENLLILTNYYGLIVVIDIKYAKTL